MNPITVFHSFGNETEVDACFFLLMSSLFVFGHVPAIFSFLFLTDVVDVRERHITVLDQVLSLRN